MYPIAVSPIDQCAHPPTVSGITEVKQKTMSCQFSYAYRASHVSSYRETVLGLVQPSFSADRLSFATFASSLVSPKLARVPHEGGRVQGWESVC